MPRILPGEQVPIDDVSARISISAGFGALQQQMLREVAAWWQGRRERGTGSLASGVAAHLSLPHLRAYWPGSAVDEDGTLYTLGLRQYPAVPDSDGHFVSTQSPEASADVARFLLGALAGETPSIGE